MSDSYEEALKKVETIVARLESGALSLDEAVSAYEEGLKLLKECYERLHAAEKKIEELTEELGEITLKQADLEEASPPGE